MIVDWKPTEKKLREFGWIGIVGFSILALVIGWKTGAFEERNWLVPGLLFGLAAYCGLFAAVMPKLLKPVYLAMSCISIVVGTVISLVIMIVLFIGIFTPLALFFRLKGRDELKLKPAPESASFWEEPSRAASSADYYRPF